MTNVSRRSVISILLATVMARAAHSHSLEELSQSFITEEKYFQPVNEEAPGFTLQDADNHVVSLAGFRGKVVVVQFVYTNCPDVCPLHAEKIADVQKMVNITPMKDMVEFFSITTDPKHDSGQVLRDFGENHGLDAANWVFLTAAPGAPEDSTRQLAKSYGVEFKLTPDGEQMHGIVTSVIRQDGRLVARFHGLDFHSLNLVKFINALINDHHPVNHSEPGFWDRLKEMF